ncbi:MAG: ATP-grasp domain-containing protein [Anaerolineales bacterium]|nr:ATP-grasp domain-containing protein [Anaerolineales bacterium]
MSERISVLVTGVGGGGNGHEMVKTLRLADRYKLVGVDMTSNSLGLYDVDESYLVPPATSPEYVDVLLNLCAKKDLKILIPGSEPELNILSKNRDVFLQVGVTLLINTDEVIERGLDKWKTISHLKENGFHVPVTILVHAVEDIPLDFPLPAVVKPAIGGGGSNNTFLVQDRAELNFACSSLVIQGKVVLLQEYIGTPDDEYTVGVLHSMQGDLLGSIAMRRYILSGLSNRIKMRNRTDKMDLSPILAISSGISQGEINDFPDIRSICEAIAATFNSMGPLNIQGRFVNDQWYTFEINPRFSGTSYMRALMGFNEPDMLIRLHILNDSLSLPVKYKFGTVVRGLREQVILNEFPEWFVTDAG